MDRDTMKQVLDEKVKKVEQIVYGFLPAEQGWQKTVLEAMRYSVTIGGKRLRPIMMAETYRTFAGEEETGPGFPGRSFHVKISIHMKNKTVLII